MYEIWLLSKVEWEEADPNTIIENYVKRFPGINSNSSWKPLHEVLYSRPCASSGGTRCRWDRRRRFCTPRPPPRRRRSRSTSEERPSSLLATSAPSPYSRLLLRFLPWCANPQTYLDDLNFWKRILALQIWFQNWMITEIILLNLKSEELKWDTTTTYLKECNLRIEERSALLAIKSFSSSSKSSNCTST